MRIGVGHKLFLALLLATGLVVAGMALVTAWTFERGFVRFIEARQQARVETLVERLAEVYTRDGGWEVIGADPGRWVAVLGMDREGWQPRRGPMAGMDGLHGPVNLWPPRRAIGPGPEHVPLPVELRVMLLDADRGIVYGRSEDVGRLVLNPIEVQGRTVGYLGVLSGPALESLGELRFLERQTKVILLIGAVAIALSVALAIPLSRRLVRPLRAFTAGARELAAGRYHARIPVESNDELGQLARDFNDLARALEQTEQQRRQWVADISHELRTPLAVLRGELEALQDGVRRLDRAAVDSLHAEVLRLGRLVDDLYELSMSDLGALSYRKADIDPVEVLRATLAGMRGQFAERGIEVAFAQAPGAPARVHADPNRLAQLFGNLLSNTLRYTDAPGRLEIEAARSGSMLAIELRDSPPGVPASDLPSLFDRFYRVEASRSRAHGGAGLGLALCRNIVAVHDGRIEARPSPLGGVWIHIELPLIT